MWRRLCIPLLAAGLLACNGDRPQTTVQPDPCSTDPGTDTVFELWPRSVRLPMGAAEEIHVDWLLLGCAGGFALPASDVSHAIEDTSVVLAEPGPYEDTPGFLLIPRRPGETRVSVEAGHRSGLVSVSVPDSSVMGPSVWIAGGSETSCSVESSGQIFCWGGNGGDLLGAWDDPLIGSCLGAPCSPMPVPRWDGAEAVFMGSRHACLLDATGTARCWGANSSLQLGGHARTPVVEPVEAGDGLTFSTLSLGADHSCGLTPAGDGYCWGEHFGGRLGGDQRTDPGPSPVHVSDTLRFTSVDAGGQTTCGSAEGGGLYCWGIFPPDVPSPPGAESCEVAGGKSAPTHAPCSFVPLRMPVDTGGGPEPAFVEVRGGCALTTEGAVFCLEQGTGSFEHRAGFGPYVTLVAGRLHRCGLTAAGTAECWGVGSYGALGDGSERDRSQPVPVAGGHVFTQITAGYEHTCGRTEDAGIWCWGRNRTGQAGVSIVEWPTAPAPVRVRAQG